jgi:hypothetical protein
MDIMNLIVDQALVLIPVLYVIGRFLKISSIPDKYIPISLLIFGIVLSMLLIGVSVEGFIQGVLVAGAAVFTNELVKQSNR